MIISLFLMIDWAPFHLKVLIFYHSELPEWVRYPFEKNIKVFPICKPSLLWRYASVAPHFKPSAEERGGGGERERERDTG